MKPNQCKITISEGKIKSVVPIPYGVEIISDNNIYKYSGCWAYPGFVDCHGHIAGLGFKLHELSLDQAASPEECVKLALNSKSFRGEWFVGRGWNQELWQSKVFPNSTILDAAFPDIPVYLVRVDGHAAWINSKAMSLAEIGLSTTNPPGGKILRTKSGKPNGILLDNAMELITKLIPRLSNNQLKEMIIDSCNALRRVGITEVHDMDVQPAFVSIFQELADENKLSVRIISYLKGYGDGLIGSINKQLDNPYFKVKGIKLFADGALGSRTAAMLEPYSDSPDEKGILLTNEKELFNRSKLAIENGLQVAVHAIGDAANRLVLNVYKRLYDEKIADYSTILRLEHAQIIHPIDIEIFSKYKIYASVQPVHCTSDAATMAFNRLGTRCNYAYPWKSLINSGAKLIGGSDFPIESYNPLTGLDAFIRRTPYNSENSWYPQERISAEEALSAYTDKAHEASGYSNYIGTIEAGMDADIVILNKNIIEINPKEILDCKVVACYCGGRMYSNENSVALD